MVKTRGKAFLTHAAVPRLLPPPSAGHISQGDHHHSGGDGRAAGGQGPFPATSQGALAVLQEGERGLQCCSCPPALHTTPAMSAGMTTRGKAHEKKPEEPNSRVALLGSAEHFSALKFLSFLRNLKILSNQGFDVYLIPC